MAPFRDFLWSLGSFVLKLHKLYTSTRCNNFVTVLSKFYQSVWLKLKELIPYYARSSRNNMKFIGLDPLTPHSAQSWYNISHSANQIFSDRTENSCDNWHSVVGLLNNSSRVTIVQELQLYASLFKEMAKWFSGFSLLFPSTCTAYSSIFSFFCTCSHLHISNTCQEICFDAPFLSVCYRLILDSILWIFLKS